MGVMRRIGDAVNRAYEASDLSGLAVRVNRRREAPVRQILSSGSPALAAITGMRRREANDGGSGDSTTLTLRLEWPTPLGPRVGAAAITGAGAHSPEFRLGAHVPVRYDDRHVVVDHRLPAGTGIALVDRAPEPGIDDRWTADRRLARWAPEAATVESFTRGTVPLLGIPADRWAIVLRRAEGGNAMHATGEVPPYARHYVAPGARLPVVVDPGDPATALVDWHELALRRADAAGAVDDPPPAGSIAASLIEPAAAPSVAPAAAPGEHADPRAPAPAAHDAVEGVTIEQYARVHAGLQTARVAPADHDAFAAREFGTPFGRWGAIDAEWQRRIVADWRVGAAYGAAVEAARRRRSP